MKPIDKGVPIPSPHTNVSRRKYPFAEMEIGDSFLFDKGISIRSATSQAFASGERLGRKFVCRTTDDGVRCWRTT